MMPFKSKRMMRWMFANHPKMAERWAHHTKHISQLPETAEKKAAQQSSHAEPTLSSTVADLPGWLKEAAMSAPQLFPAPTGQPLPANPVAGAPMISATPRPIAPVGPSTAPMGGLGAAQLAESATSLPSGAQFGGDLTHTLLSSGVRPIGSVRGAVPKMLQHGGLFRAPSAPGLGAQGVGPMLTAGAVGAQAGGRRTSGVAATTPNPLISNPLGKQSGWSIDLPAARQGVGEALGDVGEAVGYQKRPGRRALVLGGGTAWGGAGGAALGGGLGTLVAAMLARQLGLTGQLQAGVIGAGMGAGAAGGGIAGGVGGYQLMDRQLRRAARRNQPDEAEQLKEKQAGAGCRPGKKKGGIHRILGLMRLGDPSRRPGWRKQAGTFREALQTAAILAAPGQASMSPDEIADEQLGDILDEPPTDATDLAIWLARRQPAGVPLPQTQ